VNFHVLRDRRGLYLLDAGFIGGCRLLRRALRRRGWEREPIRGIIATHGHLDHILNIGRIRDESGAWIAGPRLDLSHYQGRPGYSGLARVTGVLEAVGRPLLGFRPFTPSRLLDDGDELEVWQGLRVVHLPGHTHGHCGFYCERLKLLFTADLFASYGFVQHYPPPIFNSDPSRMAGSVSRALALDLDGVLPNHGDSADPGTHLARLRALHGKRTPGTTEESA